MRIGLALAASAAAALLGAAPAARAEPLEVVDVVVEGNARTAERVVTQALRVKVGDRLEPGPAPQLAQRVMNLALFSAVDAEVEPGAPGQAVLRVTVEERWTLLPLPIVTSGGGQTQGGLFVVDTSFAGQGVLVALGGLVGTAGLGGMLVVQEPHLLGSDFSVALKAARRDERLEQAPDGAVLDAFQRLQSAGSLDVGWGPGEAFQLRVGWWLQEDATAPAPGYPAPPPGGRIQGPLVQLRLGHPDYHLDRTSGGAVTATLETTAGAWSARSRTLGKVRGGWAIPLRSQTLSASVSLQAVEGDPRLDAVRFGGEEGSRGSARRALWGDRVATGTLSWEVPVVTPRWGTISALGFTDIGAWRYQGAASSYVAPGVGTRLYVRGIALPAMGLDLAWRLDQSSPALSFFVGLSMQQ